MNIFGYNVNIDVNQILVWVSWILVIGVPLIIGVTLLIMHLRFKINYPFQIRIKRKRENNLYRESIAWGGFIKSPHGNYNVFRLRFHKWKWWKFKDTAKTPDLNYMDGYDDRLYYEQISPDDFIQMRVFYIPRQTESYLQTFNFDEIKEHYGEETLNQIKEKGQVEVRDEKGKTYIFKLNENSVEQIEKFEIIELYHQPVSPEKKSYVMNQFRDIDDILRQKPSFLSELAKWAIPFIIAGLVLIVGMYIQKG